MAERHTFSFRYRLGRGTVFAKDADISVEKAKFLVEGNPALTGGRIDSVKVVEDGTSLEFTVSVDDEMYDQLFGDLPRGPYSIGFIP